MSSVGAPRNEGGKARNRVASRTRAHSHTMLTWGTKTMGAPPCFGMEQGNRWSFFPKCLDPKPNDTQPLNQLGSNQPCNSMHTTNTKQLNTHAHTHKLA